jgi:hypothetical protein
MFSQTAYRSEDIEWSVAVDVNVLEEHAASIFRAEGGSMFL